MASKSAQVKITETANTVGLLKQLPLAVRRVYMHRAIARACRIVVKRAKRLVPVGQARTGKKSGKKHLGDTIAFVVRRYAGREEKSVGVVGPQYPAGAHGHLVEHGHEEVLFGRRTGRRVPPSPFMRPAVDQTQSEQLAALDNELMAGIEKEARKAR